MLESKRLRVRVIPNSAAKKILDRQHPLGAGQAFAFALGVDLDGVIRGVLTFGNPISNHAVTKYGLRQCDVLELRKMWLADELPKCSESRVLGVAARMIRKQYPRLVLLLTYCGGDEAAAAYKGSGWIAQDAHTYEREYLVAGKWYSVRDANRHGVRQQATETKRETRRKWILPLNERGRQIVGALTVKSPRRPETGNGADNVLGLARTQANSVTGSTSQQAAVESEARIGLQSTTSTTTNATPVGSPVICGVLETQINSGPR